MAEFSYYTHLNIAYAKNQMSNTHYVRKKTQNDWLLSFRLCIEQNLANPQLTVLELARQMNISERQLYRKVKQLTQCTPRQYLHQIRFSKAYNYLAQRKFSTLAATAKAVGYKDAGYFAREFKKVYETAPLELLNNTQSER